MFLGGVLVCGEPALQEAKPVAHPSITLEGYYNLGIAFVVPAPKLLDILNCEKLKAMRESREPRPIKPVPAEYSGCNSPGLPDQGRQPCVDRQLDRKPSFQVD